MNELDLTVYEQLLKVTDVAKALNISLAMAYRVVQRGEIPAIRIGTSVRVKPSDLQAYIERSRSCFMEQ